MIVVTIALTLGALNVGFLMGRVFERMDYSRRRADEKRLAENGH